MSRFDWALGIMDNWKTQHNVEFKLPRVRRPFGNIVRVGENAGNQHFLLFLQSFKYFQRISCHLSYFWMIVFKVDISLHFCYVKSHVIFFLLVFNSLPHNGDLWQPWRRNLMKYRGNQHFLLLPHCFLPIPKRIDDVTFILFANAFNLDQPKNLSFGKWLIYV